MVRPDLFDCEALTSLPSLEGLVARGVRIGGLDDLKHLQRKRSPMQRQRVPDNLIQLPHEAREEEGLARVARDGDVTRHPVRHEIAHEL